MIISISRMWSKLVNYVIQSNSMQYLIYSSLMVPSNKSTWYPNNPNNDLPSIRCYLIFYFSWVMPPSFFFFFFKEYFESEFRIWMLGDSFHVCLCMLQSLPCSWFLRLERVWDDGCTLVRSGNHSVHCVGGKLLVRGDIKGIKTLRGKKGRQD